MMAKTVQRVAPQRPLRMPASPKNLPPATPKPKTEIHKVFVDLHRDLWCPGAESNRHVPFGTRDFKLRRLRGV